MITLKHSFIIDFKLFFNTLIKKKWLDKNGYYYHLSTTKEYRKINLLELIKKIEGELIRHDFIKNLKYDYIAYLSKYGALGSFDEPNIIYINIQREPEKISLTIIHEILHLILEKEPSFKKLAHEEKEKMVEKKFQELLQKRDLSNKS